MNKKIVFIGGIWLESQEKKIIKKSRGNIQSAANALQTNIIGGIEEINKSPLTIINEIFVGAYPKRYSDIFIKHFEFNHTEDLQHKDYNVGFLNLPLVKHFFRYKNSKKYIKKICKKCQNEDIYVIGYSMSESIVKGLLFAKKINPDVKTCLIIPDLPEYMNLSETGNKVFNYIKNINIKNLYNNIKGIDSFVVLTKQMYPRLGVETPFVVVEGIASDNVIEEVCEKKKEDAVRKIVYTGTLGKKYGICDLVDAFSNIKGEDIQLIICGAGDASEYIKEKAKNDHRIKFLGIVENKVAKKIQKESYILVNPRSDKEEYTKYSFPSKTMEYMLAGRAIVMNKLGGIPDEYNEFIYYVENNLQMTLEYVLSLPEEIVKERGRKAQEFVIKKKNKYAQAEVILDMLDKL